MPFNLALNMVLCFLFQRIVLYDLLNWHLLVHLASISNIDSSSQKALKCPFLLLRISKKPTTHCGQGTISIDVPGFQTF